VTAATAERTPAQEAFVRLGDHCASAPCCRTEWSGETAVRRQCATADALYRVWFELWRKELRG
jgi:hypothetical protein